MKLKLFTLITALLLLGLDYRRTSAQGTPDGGTDAQRLVEHVTDADRVTLATVSEVRSYWSHNEYGDVLIVSQIDLTPIEHIKGPRASTVTVEIIGGNLNDHYMAATGYPDSVSVADRVAVVSQRGKVVPEGWHKMNTDGTPVTTGPTLAELRAAVRR